MSDEHTIPPHKSHTNALNTAFPAFFGRDVPKLGIHKSADWDPDTFQRRSSSAVVDEHDPAHLQQQLDGDTKTALDSSKPYVGHHHPSTMPRRTPEEEQAYLAALSQWAKDKDAMHAGDGTFGPNRGWGSAIAGASVGTFIGAVGDDQFQRDTTVRRKDGTWDVPESKDSGMGFVDTWKRRLSGQYFKERRASAEKRGEQWEKEHGHELFPGHGPNGHVQGPEHGHGPVSRLREEE